MWTDMEIAAQMHIQIDVNLSIDVDVDTYLYIHTHYVTINNRLWFCQDLWKPCVAFKF